MIHKLFDTLFNAADQERIRSFDKSEPLLTERKAFILFAYMLGYGEYDIARCVNRKKRQVRYLIDKAEDLYSTRDKEITRIIEKYETTLGQSDGSNSKTDR